MPPNQRENLDGDIFVDAPDGTVVEFPAGTSPETIRTVMGNRWGRPAPQPERPPAGYSPLAGGLAQFNQGLTLGASDEVQGIARGAANVIGAPFRGDTRSASSLFGEGYRSARESDRAIRDEFMRQSPNAGNFLEGSGAVAPMIATFGAATAPTLAAQGTRSAVAQPSRVLALGSERATADQAVRRAAAERAGRGGFAGLADRTIQAGAYGGGTGYATGFFGYEPEAQDNWADDFNNRLDNANFSAGVGASVGAAVPSAIAAPAAVMDFTRPIVRGAQNLARRIPVPSGQSVGAFGRPMAPAAGEPPATPIVPPEAIGTIERLANRRQLSPEQVGERLASARANPQGEVLADVFDVPGVNTMRSIAQSPGQSGQLAADTAQARVLAAADRIDAAARRTLGVGETRAQAMAALENDYRALSSEAYGPLWERPWTQRQEALYRQRVVPLMQDSGPVGRTMREAEAAARETFAFDVANGRARGTFDENRARALHYIKMELGEVFERQARESFGAQATRDSARRQFYRTFSDLLDPPGAGHDAIIPGYREITNRAGDFHSGRRALEAGENWLRADPADVADEVASMTEFERRHARIGLADALRRAAEGTVDGARNPVTVQLRRPSTQNAIRAAFETPEQAAEFLDTLNTQRRLVNNALQWNAGSPSWANATHGADEAINALADVGVQGASGNAGNAARRGIDFVMRRATLGLLENRNNRVGATLLRRVDSRESEAFAREVERLLLERQTAAQGQSGASIASGVGAGYQQNRERQ